MTIPHLQMSPTVKSKGKSPPPRHQWNSSNSATEESTFRRVFLGVNLLISPTHWTWVWASSGSWWWTGKPGMLQSMELQRVRQDIATEEQQRKSCLIKPVYPKGNQPWISSEGLMLKLKLQHYGHLMCRADLSEKTLMLGKIESRRRRGWQRMR